MPKKKNKKFKKKKSLKRKKKVEKKYGNTISNCLAFA